MEVPLGDDLFLRVGVLDCPHTELCLDRTNRHIQYIWLNTDSFF